MATETTISAPAGSSVGAKGMPRHHMAIFAGLLVLLVIAPFVLHPIFVMKVLCCALFARSEERRVGKACVSTCRSRWSPYKSQKTHLQEELITEHSCTLNE